MEQAQRDIRINEVTSAVLKCAFRVSNELGPGFLEKVYENALAVELRDQGLCLLQQPLVEVRYKKHLVGEYIADMIVEDSLVVEIKALARLSDSHQAQVLNYLKATRLKVALLLNFGRARIEYRRLVWAL